MLFISAFLFVVKVICWYYGHLAVICSLVGCCFSALKMEVGCSPITLELPTRLHSVRTQHTISHLRSHVAMTASVLYPEQNSSLPPGLLRMQMSVHVLWHKECLGTGPCFVTRKVEGNINISHAVKVITNELVCGFESCLMCLWFMFGRSLVQSITQKPAVVMSLLAVGYSCFFSHSCVLAIVIFPSH
jgi:hypothetical protein